MTRVQSGDNLGILCRRNGWPSCGKKTLDRIAKVNHLDRKRTLRIGRSYFISPSEVTGAEHRIRMQQEAYRIMIAESQRLKAMGIESLTDLLIKYNPRIENIPEMTENFYYPVDKIYFSDIYRKRRSEFGMRIHPFYRRPMQHNGKDVLVGMSTPIHAANKGTVLYSGFFRSYGYLTVLVHQANDNKFYTVYAHNSKNLFKEGDAVEKNQVIAFSGATGRTTGPHLHFELRLGNGEPKDPVNIINVDIKNPLAQSDKKLTLPEEEDISDIEEIDSDQNTNSIDEEI